MKTGYKICDAMTRKPISISPDASIINCAQMMNSNDVGSLVILDDNSLRGILTQKDMVTKVLASSKNPSDTKAIDVMDPEVNTIHPSADIYEGIMKMKDLDVRQLPVVDERGRLCGLLTLKDILKIEPQLFELLVDMIELKEEESKPIFSARTSEGICEICGEYSEKLVELKGSYLCSACRSREKVL